MGRARGGEVVVVEEEDGEEEKREQRMSCPRPKERESGRAARGGSGRKLQEARLKQAERLESEIWTGPRSRHALP
jgi:hypothetical protein